MSYFIIKILNGLGFQRVYNTYLNYKALEPYLGFKYSYILSAEKRRVVERKKKVSFLPSDQRLTLSKVEHKQEIQHCH